MGDDKRPSGPHNPSLRLIASESPKDRDKDHRSSSEQSRPSRTSSTVKPGGNQDAKYQRFVLTDPVAFRYLEEDPSVTVLDRRSELTGFELYIVEQWTTSRAHPTFVITTYTGDSSHKTFAGVLSVPTDESSWSQRLRIYFKALNQYHARRRETPLGILMITNLSGFPSSLTVIPVPDGDLRKHRFDFVVNENLKRMGCSGRVGLTLAQPQAATVAKFHQLYRTSDKNPLYGSVIELVKLCQAALHLFDKMDVEYADGLLCDVTEKAVNDWWIGIGAEFYSIEPHDGILGPTTVSALLGLLMGARNRLSAIGATVPKDPFDIQAMKRSILQFQKSQRIPRSRRLDHHTLTRLHKASAKAASSEGWSVPLAIKSTVAELSGKGGEMLADVVGRKDKAGIADIEVPDIERFVQLVYGERCRWLWHGKPLKSVSMDLNDGAALDSNLEFRTDEQGGFTWTGKKHHSDSGIVGGPSRVDSEESSPVLQGGKDGKLPDEEGQHRGVIKRATGSFGKFKDAVRGHKVKGSRDDVALLSPIISNPESNKSFGERPSLQRVHTSPPSSPKSNPRQSMDEAVHKRPASFYGPKRTSDEYSDRIHEAPEDSPGGSFVPLGSQELPEKQQKKPHSLKENVISTNEDHSHLELPLEHENGVSPGTSSATPSISGSLYHGVDLQDVLPQPPSFAQDIGPLLRRTNSHSTFIASRVAKPRSSLYYPRHLSLSMAVDSLYYRPITTTSPIAPKPASDLTKRYEYELLMSDDLRDMRASIAALDAREGHWTRSQLYALRALLDDADRDIAYIELQHREPAQQLQELRDAAAAFLRDEKEALGEGAKELEMLGQRLEYEIGAMRDKIEDVEVGVEDFGRAVGILEDRVKELEVQGHPTGWRCAVM